MNYEAVDPEIVRNLKRFPNFIFRNSFTVDIFRLLFELPARPVKLPSGMKLKNHPVGNKFVRSYSPGNRKTDAALVWIHGGGMVAGRAKQQDALCVEMAEEFGMAFFSLEYRLAPKHPYPAGLNDCESGFGWIVANSERFQINPKRLVIGGDSAGAGLAVSLTLKLVDEAGVVPLGQLLKYPMLDDRTAADRSLDNKHFVWNNTSNYYGWKSYLSAEPGSDADFGLAVPARVEDLSGLPASWIGVGKIDLFFAEDLAFANRLQAHGVQVSFNQYPGFPHAGELVSPDAAVSRRMALDFKNWLAELIR